jgi:hypothetical protein
LDAELLADVYINMTRGQEALVIDASEPGADDSAAPRVDLSQFKLPVLEANTQEAAAHEAVLLHSWTRPAAARRCGVLPPALWHNHGLSTGDNG